MYSKNDYRYYLEHRLGESNDYLAHYGVKGMKWNKHKALKTIGNTAQFVSDKGFLSYVDTEKKSNKVASKLSKKMRMDEVGNVARKSAKNAKMLRRKAPQIKAASRLLVAEAANAAETGIKGAIKTKRKKRRY